MFLAARRHILNLTSQSAQFELFIKRNVESEGGEEDRKIPEVQNTQQAEQRKKFWEQEKEFEAQVDYNKLSEAERLIHKIHAEAVARGHFTYDDPENGDRVFTRLRHFLKGSCCGSACRHCIYNHIKVPESKKRVRRFDTAYWTYDDDVEMTDNLAEGFNKVKPLIRKKRPTAQKLTIQTTSATPNR